MEKLFIIFTFLLWILSVHTIENEEGCGIPIGSSSTGKIVGGYDIGYFKYPWYVALKRHYSVFCGGTYIGKKFIVTAAHCFQPFFKQVGQGHTTFEKIFTPTFGIYNVCRHESTQKEFKVAKVYIHEKYKKMDPYYDITLIKLKQYPTGFKPCCLPTRALDSHTRPREAFVSGLGDLEYNAKKATCTMHEARILIYDDDVCRKMLDSQEEDGKKLIHALCAGYLEGGIDSCQGDSGGPLIITGKGGRFELLGITSFGFACAKPDVLGIYTDVSHYVDWMDQKMQDKPTTPIPSSEPGITGTSIDLGTITSVVSDTTTKGTHFFPGEPTTVNWSQYPVTPWEASTFLIPPLEPMPGELPPHYYGYNVPISIIINLMKKLAKEKSKHRRAQYKERIHKLQEEYRKRNKLMRKYQSQSHHKAHETK